jgi:hypothetical protein
MEMKKWVRKLPQTWNPGVLRPTSTRRSAYIMWHYFTTRELNLLHFLIVTDWTIKTLYLDTKYILSPITEHTLLWVQTRETRIPPGQKLKDGKVPLVYCHCLTTFPWFNPDINSTSMQPCLSQVETCWICTVWHQEEELPSLKTLAPFFALPVQQDPAWVNNRRQELDFMGVTVTPTNIWRYAMQIQ